MDRKTSNTYLLLYALILILLVCLGYRTAIEPHLQLKNDVKNLSNMGDTLSRLNNLIRKAKKSSVLSSNESAEKGFAGLVSICQQENTTIVKNKPVFVRSNADIKKILIVEIEGSYTSLVRVLHKIETSLYLGKVVTTSFSTQYDMTQKQKHLTLKLIYAISDKGTQTE